MCVCVCVCVCMCVCVLEDVQIRSTKKMRSKEVILVFHPINICGFNSEAPDNTSHGYAEDGGVVP